MGPNTSEPTLAGVYARRNGIGCRLVIFYRCMARPEEPRYASQAIPWKHVRGSTVQYSTSMSFSTRLRFMLSLGEFIHRTAFVSEQTCYPCVKANGANKTGWNIASQLALAYLSQHRVLCSVPPLFLQHGPSRPQTYKNISFLRSMCLGSAVKVPDNQHIVLHHEH